eukprot:6864516-Prymnesium_polylepis.1
MPPVPADACPLAAKGKVDSGPEGGKSCNLLMHERLGPQHVKASICADVCCKAPKCQTVHLISAAEMPDTVGGSSDS